MIGHTMKICALCLGLVVLTSAHSEGVRHFDEVERCFTAACAVQEAVRAAVRLELQEALRALEQMKEAVRLQEQSATALRHVLRQITSPTHRERDEVIALGRGTLDERLQRTDEGANELGKPLTPPSPERQDAAAAAAAVDGGLTSSQQTGRRVLDQEEDWSWFWRYTSPQTSPSTSQITSTSSSSSTPTSSSSTPTTSSSSALTFLSSSTPTTSSSSTPTSSSSSTTTSSSPFVSLSGSPSASTTAVGATSVLRGQANDLQTQEARRRVEERIQEAEARVDASIAQPSPLGEALCVATMNGTLEEVQRLLNVGADVNYACSVGSTPLIEAAWNPQPPLFVLGLLHRVIQRRPIPKKMKPLPPSCCIQNNERVVSWAHVL